MRKTTKPYTKRNEETKLRVKTKNTLLPFLIETMTDKSRSAIKSYLAHRQVAINGRVTTLFDTPVNQGDEVSIRAVGESAPNPNHRVRIVFEDEDLIVVDKKPGVLSMSTGVEGEQTAYSIMMEHVRRHRKTDRVYIVHRLDRETSGLLLLAKSEEAQERLQNDWNNTIIDRRYIAVVEGQLEKREGRIISWLTDNLKSMKVMSSPVDNGGKEAITNYRVIKSGERYSLVELHLETGRKNQIRVHMADLGHPIAGDKKYGAKSNPLGRLCLHAQTLSFYHPFSGQPMKFDTGIPPKFL